MLGPSVGALPALDERYSRRWFHHLRSTSSVGGLFPGAFRRLSSTLHRMQADAPRCERPLPDDLGRWVAADLISLAQAQRITEFENQRVRAERRGRASRGVALLGALTVVSGIGSLVAYNWARLGEAVKLGGFGILLVLSLAATVWVKGKVDGRTSTDSAAPARDSSSTALDVTLVLASGLTLAGLSLVSQIYHPDGEVWQLLFAWSLATAPLWGSRSRSSRWVFPWTVACSPSPPSSSSGV